MKRNSKYLVTILYFLLPLAVAAQADSHAWAPLIPLPVEIKQLNGSFNINPSTQIVAANSHVSNAARLLNGYVTAYGGKQLSVTTTKPAGNFILLEIDSVAISHKEGYRLHIDKSAVNCIGHDAAGVLYALQTLRQLWSAGKNNLQVPACIVHDYPRFDYRGMALDVSRHMFPVAFIKKYIDWLALYKFNIFHWHLTDDQGWRIEIKKYPRLQSVAAFRNETLIGHKKELPHRFDGKRYAALTAYPSLGCTGGPYKTATFWGVFDDVYCAGNDSTFNFLQDVLDEVMALFPSSYIHIGGDECPKTRWKVCPKCQQRIKTLGLKDEHALQSYFVQRIEKYVNSKGRNIIGWDEILEGGLAPNATVMSWRGEEGGKAAIAQQHRVIMTPESHCYFDYYQSLHANEPLAAGGYTPLKKVYNYEPMAGSADTAAKTNYLAGIEGQAWSEYYTDAAKATYMNIFLKYIQTRLFR